LIGSDSLSNAFGSVTALPAGRAAIQFGGTALAAESPTDNVTVNSSTTKEMAKDFKIDPSREKLKFSIANKKGRMARTTPPFSRDLAWIQNFPNK
jgi:hypothetical protein